MYLGLMILHTVLTLLQDKPEHTDKETNAISDPRCVRSLVAKTFHRHDPTALGPLMECAHKAGYDDVADRAQRLLDDMMRKRDQRVFEAPQFGVKV